ncbi:hypothetical protein SEA_LILPHARAOH_47 [Mycobacterium phage LilPharaoh]|uniref:DUF3310 domain-containing protein n=1 Tax=Mycobacterium phage Amelie TaxID=1913035 RepID=A0A1J0GQ05_9CAUD|nr:hypothetical protein AVV01_gp49 [Mycobacterium phage Enkosi]YP_009952565.1 hypothetical protein I5G92_gp47 [Mycobacterium phage Amelie]ATN90500.1 hypothetical protein SEA_LILPHARAOH_47 [Mycobacterium phage LilPharaoh]AVP42624.1 hypothetical protein SEA_SGTBEANSPROUT_47 [Mycobacterium phage SgtBeansprout]AXC37153.1 hypothetical protein SEA_BIGLEBOPS_47 [Mycobacterium phage Biglebops]QGJ93332.1 hypothetical protein PBI_MDAVU_48 [Mycobacterium phage Mdavu]UQS94447.1 hypothetical protein SEA_N
MTDRPLCMACGQYEARMFDPSGAMWCRVCDLSGLGPALANNLAAESDELTSEDNSAGAARGQTPDMVAHPAHYTSSPAQCSECGHPIECIDITQHMGFCLGNATKYIWRCDLKNDAIEDLRKAIQYIEFEIERREALSTTE